MNFMKHNIYFDITKHSPVLFSALTDIHSLSHSVRVAQTQMGTSLSNSCGPLIVIVIIICRFLWYFYSVLGGEVTMVSPHTTLKERDREDKRHLLYYNVAPMCGLWVFCVFTQDISVGSGCLQIAWNNVAFILDNFKTKL